MERRSHPRRPSSSSSSSNPSTNHRISNPNHYPGNTNNSRQRKSNCQDVISHEAPSIVGTCPFMCPVGERIRREQLRDLAVFERLDGNPRRTSPDLAVKKFCRTISTKDSQASDVRPLPVLEDTLNYLLNLMDSAEYPFEVVHDFVFDRTRSIRQDLSIQNIINDQAIRLLEKMSKFYILSHHKLRSCHGRPNTSSMSYLNMEQLTKSLMSLYNLYEANRKSDYVRENEAEFLSFYVLLHLGSISQPTGESLSPWFHNVPPHIIKSKEMRFARQVLRFFRMGNYKQFLCTVAAEASYLQYCILESNISEVRALALSYINHGCYKLHPYPLAHLSKLLMMKESDVESLCKCCGLEIFTDEVGDKFLPTKQTSFCWPKEGLQKYCFLGLKQYERKTAA